MISSVIVTTQMCVIPSYRVCLPLIYWLRQHKHPFLDPWCQRYKAIVRYLQRYFFCSNDKKIRIKKERRKIPPIRPGGTFYIVTKPFIEAENKFNNELVIAVLPDHPTPCEIRTHSAEPIPFAIYNPLKASNTEMTREFSERTGKEGQYGLIENGEEFMRLLLS